MKTRVFTRLFAMLFAVVMVCSVLPLGVSAATTGFQIDRGVIEADPDQTLTLNHLIQLRCPYCNAPWPRSYNEETGVRKPNTGFNIKETNATATIEFDDEYTEEGLYWSEKRQAWVPRQGFVMHVTYNTNGMKPGDEKTITITYDYVVQIAMRYYTGSKDYYYMGCANPACGQSFRPSDFTSILHDTLTFTVKVKQDPLYIDLTAKKNLDNSPANVNDFQFELLNPNGREQIQSNNGGNIKFTAITFKEAGDYSFTLYEVNKNSPKYIYDNTQYTVEVKVISNDKGELVVDKGYPKFTNKTTGEVVSEPVFNNYSKREIFGKKVWEDGNEADGARPATITINMNGTAYTVTPDADGKWKLPGYFDRYQADGKTEIQYTVTETQVANYEKPDVKGDMNSGFVITNTRNFEKIDIPVTKVWSDGDNQDGKRPESVTVMLIANGQYAGKTLELTKDGEWKGTFKDLPKNAKGEEITYTVEEVTTGLPESYKSTATGNADGSWTVTNSYTPETTSVKVTKEWDHKGAGTEENEIKPDEVTVKLFADDQEQADKTLILNEANNWTDTFTDLPKFKDGKKIVYTVDEKPVTDYEKQPITGDAANGYIIKNVFKPGTIVINVTKEWADNNDQDGKRPDKITVNLMRNKGQTLVDSKEVTANSEGKWTTSFSVPERDHKSVIDYSVTDAVDDYDTAVAGDKEQGFIITNTHTPETIDKLTVITKWVDFNNQYSTRPDTTTVRIQDKNNKDVKVITLTANDKTDENTWEKTLENLNLPMYEAGEEITYTVVEDAVTDYSTAPSSVPLDSDTEKAEFTNTLNTLAGGINVTKVWKADREDKRPDSITVYLYAGDDKSAIQKATITKGDGWAYTFTDLPATRNGEEIRYSVAEAPVPAGYGKPDYSGDKDSGFTITNTKKSPTVYKPSGKLLQTGQLNWPVPVLAVGGVALLAVGVYLVLQKKKGRYES